MSKIKVLPDSLANKIAAGEVVERPASIVKELIENSLDAGAHSIRIEIEAGGRRLIKVSDDGEGMAREDAILAFERHATSKIKTAEDLEAIVTLGFRGEALASIASVAKVRLRTRTGDDIAGTEIEISGGRMLRVRDTAFPRGSEFEIRDLFFNVPARQKFLKSEGTENSHIANLVTHYALANPRVSFSLIINGRESIQATPSSDIRERAYQLFGAGFIDDLIEVSGRMGDLGVRGFVSSPSITRSNRDSQYFFINGRYVRDKILNKAVSDAYLAMIPSNTYPAAMLFVELPPHDVDVNVHPAKTEVRFVRATVVFDLVRDSIRSAISAARAAATPFGERSAPAAPAEPVESHAGHVTEIWPPQMPVATEAPTHTPYEPAPPPEQRKMKLDHQPMSVIESPEPAIVSRAAIEPAAPAVVEKSYGRRIGCLGGKYYEAPGSTLRAAGNLSLSAEEINPLGQLHNSFIIAADRSGLLVIDQHVAHERILFEQHWRALRNRRVEVQRLLIPETIDLTPAQAAAFDQAAPKLEENGFEIGRLSGRTIAVKALPAILSAGTAQSLLADLLDTIEDERRSLSMDELSSEIAASLACRAAVKINMPLAHEKQRWLIDELLKMDNPATCPHGRPIILRIASRDIEKGFQRI